MNPLVTVIIPTYNRSYLLSRAINSVINQTYANLECIVVNDASTDGTDEVLRKYSDQRLRYFKHKENRHVSAARNTAIGKARGELVAFLDDDDEWLPKKLEKQVDLIQKISPEYGMVYCWMDIYKKFKKIGEVHPILRGDIFSNTLLKQPIGNCSTLMVRMNVVKEVGNFDEMLPRGNDGDFIRRICKKYKVDFVPEVLGHYIVGHNDRITSQSTHGIRQALHGEETKLVKFNEDLKNMPHIHAGILRKISGHCKYLGDFDRADNLLFKAAVLEKRRFLWILKIYLRLPKTIRLPAYRNYLRFMSVRQWLRNSTIINLKRTIFLLLQRILDRLRWNNLNRLYPSDWFAQRKSGEWNLDVRSFCENVYKSFKPASVADVGCGPGVYLQVFEELGTKKTFGLEGTDNALNNAVVPVIQKQDLRLPFKAVEKFELVLCLEVAEHIHVKYSDILVDTVVDLCLSGGAVVFTAAVPGQGGFHHINLQPREFWISKFSDRGCHYSETSSVQISKRLDLKVLPWLKQNIMVFIRDSE